MTINKADIRVCIETYTILYFFRQLEFVQCFITQLWSVYRNVVEIRYC